MHTVENSPGAQGLMNQWDWKNALNKTIKQNLFLPIIQCWVWGRWLCEEAVNYEMRCFSALHNNPSASPLLYSGLLFYTFIYHVTLFRTMPISTWACVRLKIETAWRFFFPAFLLFVLGFRRRKCRWDVHKTYIWSWITAASLLQNTLQLSHIKRLSYINNAPTSKEAEFYQHAAD